MLLVVIGIVGGRLFYVLEHGGPLLATRGFTFDGGLIAAAIVVAVAVRRMGLATIYNTQWSSVPILAGGLLGRAVQAHRHTADMRAPAP